MRAAAACVCVCVCVCVCEVWCVADQEPLAAQGREKKGHIAGQLLKSVGVRCPNRTEYCRNLTEYWKRK
jgi:hypothetical protein